MPTQLSIRLAAVATLATATFALAIADPVPAASKPPAGILVLDDSDPEFRGKPTYTDGLTAIGLAGDVKFRVSGLNGCQSIGCSRLVAADPVFGHIWVAEIAGHRLRRYDRRGKETLTIPDVRASALAVDPNTGHLWVLTTKGTIHGDRLEVYAPDGSAVAVHPVGGYDLCYDPKGNAFWVAGQNLTKVSAATGEVLFSFPVAVWCASSVAVHPATGRVWVSVRKHPEVAGSANRLVVCENDGARRFALELDEVVPFHMTVDPDTGDGWMSVPRKSIRRYSDAGKLIGEHPVPALAALAPGVGGDVWVVTGEETVRMTPAGKTVHRVKHARPTGQAWIAAY